MWWGAIAEAQLGLVTWDQGLAAVGHDCMVRAISSGLLLRKRPGVYLVSGAPWTKETDLLAVCLSADAVASHRAAAQREGFPRIHSLRPEITTTADKRVRLAGVKAHRSTYLPPNHITVVDGIPCTTPARTAVDLSAVLGDDSVKRMLQDANHHRVVSYAEVVHVLGDLRRRGRRRVAHLAPILDDLLSVGEKSESRGELWVVKTLVKAGMPVPEQQIWVITNGGRFCVDVGYVAEKVGIEFDGWWAHGGHGAFVSDRDRISELELAGWLMLPVTHETTASVLVDRVQRALALRRSTSGHSGAHGAPECPEVDEDGSQGYGS